MYGSLLLGTLALVGAITWGFLVKGWAEKEAKNEARRWLAEEAPPILRREVREFLKTFSQESFISESDVDAMAAAAGDEGEEGENGKEK